MGEDDILFIMCVYVLAGGHKVYFLTFIATEKEWYLAIKVVMENAKRSDYIWIHCI